MSITTVGAIKLLDKQLIQQYIAEIRSDSNPRNFLALSYQEGSSDVIVVKATGSYDLEEVKGCISNDDIVWMFWRVVAGDDLSHRVRFITITASGEKVSLFKRTRSMHHSFTILNNIFGQSHVNYVVSSPDDLTEEFILQKLSLSVNYDKTKRVRLTKDTGMVEGVQDSPIEPEQKEVKQTNTEVNEEPIEFVEHKAEPIIEPEVKPDNEIEEKIEEVNEPKEKKEEIAEEEVGDSEKEKSIVEENPEIVEEQKEEVVEEIDEKEENKVEEENLDENPEIVDDEKEEVKEEEDDEF